MESRRACAAILSLTVALSACTSARPLWRALPEAPISGRIGEGVVWTGSEMLILGWSGRTRACRWRGVQPGNEHVARHRTAPQRVFLVMWLLPRGRGPARCFGRVISPDGPADGAVYTPATNTWRRLKKGPLGPREGGASVWTGKELIIIGGAAGDTSARPVAAALDPVTGRWRLLRGFDRLYGLAAAGAVWNGSEVFVTGALALCAEKDSRCARTRPIFIAYNPATDSVREIP